MLNTSLLNNSYRIKWKKKIATFIFVIVFKLKKRVELIKFRVNLFC